MSELPQRQKIAILGGGMASLTTAFELTSQPGWDSLYDITVYQMGWRLGGKGASGRNLQPHADAAEPTYRIEEHGLHIFFGFYENAFRLMQRCYAEMGGNGPLATVEDAFKPHNLIVLQEYANDQWQPISLNFPPNALRPWTGGCRWSLWQHVCTTIRFVLSLYVEYRQIQRSPQTGSPQFLETLIEQFEVGREIFEYAFDGVFLHLPAHLLRSLVQEPQRWQAWLGSAFERIEKTFKTWDVGSEGAFLHLALQLAEALPENPSFHRREHHRLLVQLLERFIDRFSLRCAAESDEIYDGRWRLALIDIALANLKGLLVDGIVYHGSLAAIDHLDYRTWLLQHGARPSSLQSAFIRVLYDLVYAFPGGNITQPRLAAGVAVRILITIIFQYNGAVMWKMQGGMGDVVFTPLYTVLKRRGVKFEFFHRVQHLHLNAEKTAIAEITLGRQATLKDPAQGYEPLITVKGMGCWPSEPHYDQLVEGAELKQQGINLESYWSPWKQRETPVTLKAGQDFDLVLLGISLAALPDLCQELIAASPRWQTLLDQTQAKTVPTQGGQLWLTPTLSQLGWPLASPVVGAYVEPLDTYADMSDLLPRENWPAENYPHNLAYFTGVIADPGIPPADHYDFPAQAQAAVEARSLHFLENDIGYLWPLATAAGQPRSLAANLLVDLDNGQGLAERLQSQYWRINIFPTERYVLSLPGTLSQRLKADESGFDNLYLAGDWVNNGYNASCIEATVMSSMQAARAILKQQFGLSYGKPIIGEWDSWIFGKYA
ncbi:NAD(P)-binding protein [Almyronema epifaneia]|uniref:NAD(P)-binding protein n=1 Tax=Almyronema epifaneia S1 TaxID=2991925 RepID=A0ABW6IGF8_9CYAN